MDLPFSSSLQIFINYLVVNSAFICNEIYNRLDSLEIEDLE